MNEQKAQLRKRIRRERAALSLHERERQTQEVWEQLLNLELKGPIFVYVSVRKELATEGLITRLSPQHSIAIPRITAEGIMEAALYEEPLVAGPFGVPTTTGPVIEPRTILLPGLAFDRQGGRLGYGGGYYDRWLAAHPTVHSIGLGFALQLLDRVPREPHDRLLDQVICATP